VNRAGLYKRVGATAALLVAWTFAAAEGARAQEVKVRAEVERTRVGQGEDVLLTVDIQAPSFDQTAPPDVSRMEDFDIVGGPSVSSRFQWINGRTSSTRTYSYVLRPRGGVGTWTIPPLGLLIQGRTYYTQRIEVEVVPGRAGGGAGGPAVPPGGVRGGPSRPPPADLGRPLREGGQGVLVRAEVDTRTAYVGQQVTIRYLLDTQTEVLNLALKDSPTFPGFWAEDIKLPENLDARRVQRGGGIYTEYTLMKKALFPTTSGTLTLPAVSYQIQVRRRSQDPIESFFFTPTETIVRKTEPIVLTVLPLPGASRPSGFSGAVGNFTLSVTADRKESRVNDAIGVKVRLAGEGNLNTVKAVSLADLSDFKRYAPKVSSTISVQEDRLRGEKVWDYVLIPLAPGAQTIPPVSFSYFDPEAKTYKTLSSPPIPIQVARGEDRPGGLPGGPVMAQSDVRQVRRDIHYIKQAPGGLRDRSRRLERSPIFLALIALPIVADAGIFTFTRLRNRRPAGARARRERKARRVAHRRLREARRRMSSDTSRPFYAEVARALAEYVADKFDASATGLTRDRIEELLASRGVSEEERAEFHRCLEACDYARFAPASSTRSEMQKALGSAEKILVALERSLAA
jgi:oxygen tolerance protein BatD